LITLEDLGVTRNESSEDQQLGGDPWRHSCAPGRALPDNTANPIDALLYVSASDCAMGQSLANLRPPTGPTATQEVFLSRKKFGGCSAGLTNEL
jgi:hypothetical protein